MAAPPSEEKPDLHTLLERCQSAALAVKQLKSNFRKIADHTLESIYRLHLLSPSDPAAKQALELEYKKAKIRRSKNTTTEFTLLIKLFFGKRLSRPTVSRWSSTLQVALEKKQKPQDLVAFIREKGGTAACAHLLAQQRHEDTKGAVKNPQSTAMRVIKERLADAPKIKLPKGLGIGGKGLFELLVKPQADDSCAVEGAASGRGQRRPQVCPDGGEARRRCDGAQASLYSGDGSGGPSASDPLPACGNAPGDDLLAPGPFGRPDPQVFCGAGHRRPGRGAAAPSSSVAGAGRRGPRRRARRGPALVGNSGMRGTDGDAMHPAEAIRRGLGDIYDFGGDWEHRLIPTNIRQGEPGIG